MALLGLNLRRSCASFFAHIGIKPMGLLTVHDIKDVYLSPCKIRALAIDFSDFQITDAYNFWK